MTSLRQRLNTQITEHLQRRHPAADTPPSLCPSKPMGMAAANQPTWRALECWACSGHMQPCSRLDCPKVWRLKNCPEIVTEGKSK